ncbi:MAG: HAD family hydrolase [Lachnospiraceae bacterium]|nr:HAD family hydrolase [Lachnospiraceae bacterium]
MITTVIFDMGGTLEDIWYTDETTRDAWEKAIAILNSHGLDPKCSLEEFGEKLMEGIKNYKKLSESQMIELKPEQIWPEYYLAAFDFDRDTLRACAEELAGMWEVTYYHRELRPHVKEMLSSLKEKGYRISVISNTASIYSVFDVLEDYGIREYMEDVTLSSVTGYRKPHTDIFKISLREMRCKPEECCYVGDTISRDIIGATRAGFGKTIRIDSFLSNQKDKDVKDLIQPDHVVKDLMEIVDILQSNNE